MDSSANEHIMDVPVAPIGFNLPKEFQQRVTIGQLLYPQLNTATAGNYHHHRHHHQLTSVVYC